MKHILTIGHNDLRLFLKKKSSYIWLFVVPLMFVYFMSFVSKGASDPANRRPAVLIDNADTNFLGRVFLDELGSHGLKVIKPADRESAARGIRIPADFTEKALQRKEAKVQFFKRNSADEADAAIVEARLVRALIALNGHMLQASSVSNGPLTEARIRAAMSASNHVTLNSRFAGRQPVPSGFNFSLPGNLVMYLMMNLLIFGGATVAAERREGVLRRLMVHPVTRTELVLGKIYGLILLGSVQTAFLLVAGKLLFKVNIGANLPAVLVTLLVFAWVAGSFGVLAGSLLRSDDRVVGVCVLLSLLMAALGGCWWPLELGPSSIKTIALCLPTGWALKALHQVISFGSGFNAVLVPLAVLGAFGIAANLLAIRFFRS